MKKEFQYTVETSKPFDVVVQAVQRKTAEKGFCVLHTHDVAAALAEKGGSPGIRGRLSRSARCYPSEALKKGWFQRSRHPARRKRPHVSTSAIGVADPEQWTPRPGPSVSDQCTSDQVDATSNPIRAGRGRQRRRSSGLPGWGKIVFANSALGTNPVGIDSPP
jgi:hypothetical protein